VICTCAWFFVLESPARIKCALFQDEHPKYKYKSTKFTLFQTLKLLKNIPSSVSARPAGGRAPGWWPAARKYQAPLIGVRLRPAKQRRKVKNLLERLLPCVNMATDESVICSRIKRGDHLPCDYQFLQVWCVTRQKSLSRYRQTPRREFQ